MSVKTLYLVVFLDALGSGLTLPLVNSHVLALGGSLSLAGLLQSLTAGAQLFASPVIGGWSDTRGRKLLLISTLSVVFISDALIGFPSLLIFFIGRILYGMVHQTDPLIKALIADSVPQEEVSGAYNKLMASMVSAFLIAPILGGLFYEVVKSFGYISLVLCSLDVVTISVAFLLVQEPVKAKNKDDKEKENTKTTFIQSIGADLGKIFSNLKNVEWSKYGDLLAIKFIMEAASQMLFMNMGVVLMQKFLYTRTQIGVAISFLSISMIAATLLAGVMIKSVYKADRSGFQRILHGFTLMLITFCIMPFTSTAVLYMVTFVPFCIIKAMLDTTYMEIMSKRTTEADKGVLMGAGTSMLSLAGLICPLINGFTGDFVGVEALRILPLIPAVAGSVLITKVKHRINALTEKRD